MATISERIDHHLERHRILEEQVSRHGPGLIRNLMDQRGYSLRGIARELGKSPTYLSLVMNGKQKCTFELYQSLYRLYLGRGA